MCFVLVSTFFPPARTMRGNWSKTWLIVPGRGRRGRRRGTGQKKWRGRVKRGRERRKDEEFTQSPSFVSFPHLGGPLIWLQSFPERNEKGYPSVFFSPLHPPPLSDQRRERKEDCWCQPPTASFVLVLKETEESTKVYLSPFFLGGEQLAWSLDGKWRPRIAGLVAKNPLDPMSFQKRVSLAHFVLALRK